MESSQTYKEIVLSQLSPEEAIALALSARQRLVVAQ